MNSLFLFVKKRNVLRKSGELVKGCVLPFNIVFEAYKDEYNIEHDKLLARSALILMEKDFSRVYEYLYVVMSNALTTEFYNIVKNIYTTPYTEIYYRYKTVYNCAYPNNPDDDCDNQSQSAAVFLPIQQK